MIDLQYVRLINQNGNLQDSAHRTLDCTKGSHSEHPLSAVQIQIGIDFADLESSRRTGLCTYSRFAIGGSRFLGLAQARSFFLRARDVANVNIQTCKIRVALNQCWVRGLTGDHVLSSVQCGVLRNRVCHLGQA